MILLITLTLCFCDRNNSLNVDTPSSSTATQNLSNSIDSNKQQVVSSSQKSHEQHESSTIVLDQLSSSPVELSNSFISSSSVQDTFVSCENYYHIEGLIDSSITFQEADSITIDCLTKSSSLHNENYLFLQSVIDNQKPVLYDKFERSNYEDKIEYYTSKASESSIYVHTTIQSTGKFGFFSELWVFKDSIKDTLSFQTTEYFKSGIRFYPVIKNLYSLSDSLVIYDVGVEGYTNYPFDVVYGENRAIRVKNIQMDSVVGQHPISINPTDVVENNGVLFGFGDRYEPDKQPTIVFDFVNDSNVVMDYTFDVISEDPILPVELLDSTIIFSNFNTYYWVKIDSELEQKMFEKLLQQRTLIEKELAVDNWKPIIDVTIYFFDDPFYFPNCWPIDNTENLDSSQIDSIIAFDYSTIDSLRTDIHIYFEDYSKGSLFATSTKDPNSEKIYKVTPNGFKVDCGDNEYSWACQNDEVEVYDVKKYRSDQYLWYESKNSEISGPYSPSLKGGCSIDWWYDLARSRFE
ncbi:MAG: hypothetical protein OCC49_09420 [Fibrobacterales bacterium]